MKCIWCDIREADKTKTSCTPCNRQRCRRPKCPHCEGPTYGDDNFCPKCGPYRPAEDPAEDEVAIMMISPQKKEREIYRKVGKTINRRWISKADLAEKYIVIDVPLHVWLGAKWR